MDRRLQTLLLPEESIKLSSRRSQAVFRIFKAPAKALFASAPERATEGAPRAWRFAIRIKRTPFGPGLEGCRIGSKTRADYLDDPCTDVVIPAEHPRIDGEIARLDNGAVHRSGWRFRRKDGTV